MPVAIGDELKLENNRVNAYYDNLFRKLNVAKAWTNVTTTSSGGTITVVNDEGVITNMECEYNNFYTPSYCIGDAYEIPYCIIDGKLYKSTDNGLVQIGNKSDWIKCTSCSSITSEHLYGIDSSNKLYKFTNTSTGTIQEIGSGINWTDACGYIFALFIGDGKLYHYNNNNNSLVQIGTETGWTKLTPFSGEKGYGLCNGYVYYINSSDYRTFFTNLMDSNNNFIDISAGDTSGSSGTLYALNSSGELYTEDNTQHLVRVNYNYGTVKKIYKISSSDGCVITTDNKLYYAGYELGSGINWTDAICNLNNTVLAIGNNKLYKIIPDSSGGVITQIGSSSGYKKIMGSISSNYPKIISLAWTGNATETSTTVYTTNNPIANDRTYSDTNLTEYSVVQSCDGTTLTDNYRTYELDISKNGHFNGIPPATAHETVKAIDILRATE